jgi:MoxR-like ATPase
MHQVGTFPLPESQLDRFLMRLNLGYPDAKAERELLRGAERRDLISVLEPAMSAAQLVELQRAVPTMQCSDALVDYVQQLINHTRHSPRFTQGLSPRAGVAILRAAQAWAMMEGRRQVLPEDVQAVLPAVVGHRLHGNAEAVKGGFDASKELIASVPIP